jgi:hypothetical protein
MVGRRSAGGGYASNHAGRLPEPRDARAAPRRPAPRPIRAQAGNGPAIAGVPFGESDDPELSGLERHGTPTEAGGWPSVWNVEAARPVTGEPAVDGAIRDEIEQEFVRYVRSGH